jgi:cell division protein FtsB
MSLGTLAFSRNGTAAGRRRNPRLGYRLALSIYVGLAVYCALSLLLGPAGIAAYRRLEARKGAMEANLAQLGSLRSSLNAELESLKSDPDRAAREARSLGYLRRGETILLLGDRKDDPKPPDTGKVLPYAQPAALSDDSAKWIALGVALAVLAILMAPRPASRFGTYR